MSAYQYNCYLFTPPKSQKHFNKQYFMQMHCQLFRSTVVKPSRVHSCLDHVFLVSLMYDTSGRKPGHHCQLTPFLQQMLLHVLHFSPNFSVIQTLSCKYTPKGCKPYTPKVHNVLWKRTVGWGWWSARPHGCYHHGLDHRMHDVARWRGQLVQR